MRKEKQEEDLNDICYKKQISVKKICFKILRPGGNDTCLFLNINQSKKERKYLNDEIFKYYKLLEQVGFVNKNDGEEELIMAGGEFCGNAMRSSVYEILNGKTGEIKIKVSGIKNGRLLNAGISEDKKVWSEIPFFTEFTYVQKLADKKHIVHLEGITYIVMRNNLANLKNKDEIKKQALELLKLYDLTKEDASGVIYYEENNEVYSIIPVVFVKSIKTLFYETACGSGTAALGQVIAKEKKKTIENVKIIQPSKEVISVSVIVKNNKFKNVKIAGKLDVLVDGKYIEEKGIKYIIEKIETTKDLKEKLNNGLTKLSQGIFPKQTCEIFNQYVKNGYLFTSRNYTKTIGFLAVTILKNSTALTRLLRNKTISKNVWYIEEGGVSQQWQGKNIELRLIESAIDTIPKGDIVIAKINIVNTTIWNLYKKLGFKILKNKKVLHEKNLLKSKDQLFIYLIKK